MYIKTLTLTMEMVPDIQFSSSQLYNIEPIGIGTPYCESLTSYMVRLAEVHKVRVGILFNKVVAPMLNKAYLNRSISSGGNRFFDGAKALNGVDKNSLDVASTLMTLTSRKDLLSLSLKNWDNVLTSRGLLNDFVSWCPYCLKEFKNEKNFYYYPLLWFMEPVKSCLIHNVVLLNKCHVCTKKVPILHRKSVNGFCPYCNSQLFELTSSKILPRDREKQKYIIDNLGELLVVGQKTKLKLKRDVIKIQLNKMTQYYFYEYNVQLSKALGISKTTFYYWLRGDSIPSLGTLLYICQQTGITFNDFLYKKTIFPSKVLEKESSNKDKVFRRKLDDSTIEKKLQKYVFYTDSLSMESIASEMKIPKRSLYKKFPELCKTLSKKYLDEMKVKSDARKEEVKFLIEQSVERLINDGKYPTQKLIEKDLSAECLLRESFAKEYLGIYLKSVNILEVK